MRAAISVVMVGLAVAIVAAQGPGGPGAMAPREERKLVAQFDTDGDRRVNAAERKAAREWLAGQPQAGPLAMLRRMGQGGGMGRGYEPATPGARMTPAAVPSGGSRPTGPPPAGAPGAGALPGPPPGVPPGMPPMPMVAMAAAKPALDPLHGLNDETKPLRSRLLAVPALRATYLRYVREIAETHLDWQKIEPVARRYQALIAAAVKADTRRLYSYQRFQHDLTEGEHGLKPFIEARRAFLLKTLPR